MIARCLLACLLAGCLLITLHSAVHAQDRNASVIMTNDRGIPIPLTRINEPITIDGVVDEPVWDEIDPLEHVVYQPLFMADPSERTELRVAYDDEFVYLSGRMYVEDPSTIRGNSLYRDQYSGDDILAILLDTFNDNENIMWFATTPTGVRQDYAVANDARIGTDFRNAINQSWNTFWDTAATQDDEGWYAEIRVPFSSLRFQDADGHVVMGLSAYRFIASNNERHIYPATPPNWTMGFAKASMAQDVSFDGVFSNKPVYVTPYILGGPSQQSTLNDDETAYGMNNSFTREIGADLKYNLTSNLTLDLTANTDFAQVEADDQQVNLSRISLFFPEKRQFFQERAGIFEFGTGRIDRLFYSRRIGLNGGEQVRILGGARVTGRLGDWDVGFINMQTGKSDFLPTENFGVFRLRRQVVNEFSYAGGMLTSRLGRGGAYNYAVGVDLSLRPFGDEYLTVRWANTFDSDLPFEDTNLWQSSVFRANWERRNQEGFSYMWTVKRYGPDFNPEMGFITRSDIVAVAHRYEYGFFGDETKKYRRISPEINPTMIFRNEDGSVETATIRSGVQIETRKGDFFWFGPDFSYEDLRTPLNLPENAVVEPGSYWFYDVGGGFFGSPSRRASHNSMFSIGPFYDGWRFNLSTGPEWTPNQHFQIDAEYSLDVVRFPDRDIAFNAHILRLRTQIALDTKFSVSGFAQWSSVADFIGANIRFRYNFQEGNDLWLVFNQGLNIDRTSTINENRIMLPRVDNRLVLLKYTYTFKG